jgi:hypothetical protein
LIVHSSFIVIINRCGMSNCLRENVSLVSDEGSTTVEVVKYRVIDIDIASIVTQLNEAVKLIDEVRKFRVLRS